MVRGCRQRRDCVRDLTANPSLVIGIGSKVHKRSHVTGSGSPNGLLRHFADWAKWNGKNIDRSRGEHLLLERWPFKGDVVETMPGFVRRD